MAAAVVAATTTSSSVSVYWLKDRPHRCKKHLASSQLSFGSESSGKFFPILDSACWFKTVEINRCIVTLIKCALICGCVCVYVCVSGGGGVGLAWT